MNRLMVWLPLGVFAILVGFFFKGSHSTQQSNRQR